MELIGKLSSKNTSKIVIILSVSKDISVEFADQCIYIMNNKEKFKWTQRYPKNEKDTITVQI